jgi:hypothetical protein
MFKVIIANASLERKIGIMLPTPHPLPGPRGIEVYSIIHIASTAKAHSRIIV